MSIEDWQASLRREYGVLQNFEMENIGQEKIFSEFIITNPDTKGRYRVAIRGEARGENYCSCPDYSVNTLGTCKHIEFTLARLKEKQGARVEFQKGFRPAYSEVYLRYGLRREVAFKAGTECPEAIKSLASEFFNEMNVLKPENYSRFEIFLNQAGHHEHQLRCYDDALEYVANCRDREKLDRLIHKEFAQGPESPGFEELLNLKLYRYQREGALFAAGAGRSIIADDMGLGKTIQALGACEIMARTVGLERVLIICPTSLKHQWKEEIEKFSPQKAEVAEGLMARRKKTYETDSFFKITNYELVHRDRDYIKKWAPDMIVLDEAQRVKNWKTRTAQSVKRLDSQYALVLTGTPLENRLEELHSIVEFVDRYRLGPLFRFLAEHRVTEEADGTGKVIGYKNLQKITETLAPILIRRNKNEVLSELPERIDKKFFVDMTREQRQHHEENREIVARVVAKWKKYKFISDADKQRLMIALQNMRMSCNSTYLLDQETDFGFKVDELMAYLGDAFESGETKAVVFSQWIRTHELILKRLNGNGWGHVFFHGGVPSPKRKKLIHQFKTDPDCRLFLSTDAGGVGLNLQAAQVVVNMDQPWNPAVLEQRIGRVHRLGQHQPVRVVDFIARGTIEHGMLSLLAFKKSLFTGVLEGQQDEVFLEGQQLNRFMDTISDVAEAIPEAAPAGDTSQDYPADGLREETMEEQAALKAFPKERLWQDVATTGIELLGKIGQALGLDQERPVESALGLASSLIEKDEKGQPYLKLPMPQAETIQKVVDFFSQFTRKTG